MKGTLSILYLAVFGTVVAFNIYYWLLKRVDAVFVSLVTMITPVLAVVLGVVFLHEVFSTRTIAGAALVLLGVLISNGKEIGRSRTARKSRSLVATE